MHVDALQKAHKLQKKYKNFRQHGPNMHIYLYDMPLSERALHNNNSAI